MAEGHSEWRRVHAAVENGNRSALRTLLKSGADPNVLDDQNFSPLLHAVRSKSFNLALELLSHGAIADFGGGVYGSPLHVATVNVDPAITALLLQFGADPNFADGDGHTPLHVLFSVFDSGGDKSIAISLFLLMNGANCNIIGRGGWAPIHLATKRNQEQALQFVADCCRIRRIFEIGGYVPPGSLAASSNFDLNVPGGPQKWTPLHLAAREGLTVALKTLLGAGANPTLTNSVGRSPRDVCGGQFECHKLLQRAEKEWYWWKIFHSKPSQQRQLSPKRSDNLLTTFLMKKSELQKRSSSNSSVCSLMSRRSIRKSRTLRFAQTVVDDADSDESDRDTPSGGDSPACSTTTLESQYPSAQVVNQPKTSHWNKESVVEELTAFMEPDVPFDVEELREDKLYEFMKTRLRQSRPMTQDTTHQWSTAVFDQSTEPNLTIPMEGIGTSPNDIAPPGLADLGDTAGHMMFRSTSDSVHAPLTARTHKRFNEATVERSLLLPSGLGSPREPKSQYASLVQPLNLNKLAFDIHTPTKASSPLRVECDTVRLNALLTACNLQIQDEEEEAKPLDSLLEYYWTLSMVTLEDCDSDRSHQANAYFKSLEQTMKCYIDVANRQKHFSTLAGPLLTTPRRDLWATKIFDETLALIMDSIRVSDTLYNVTLEDEVVSSAQYIYKLAYHFAVANNAVALRQMLMRLTINELISVRSMELNGSKLLARCIANGKVNEETVLVLLAFIPYDPRSSQHELNIAIYRRMFKVVKLLLVQGADPNALDANGRNALHTATLNRCRLILLCLMYHPSIEVNTTTASNTYKPNSGQTALEIAIHRADVFAISVLLNRGAVVRLGQVHRGQWLDSKSAPKFGNGLMSNDLLQRISDPQKREVIAEILEANNFNLNLGTEVSNKLLHYIYTVLDKPERSHRSRLMMGRLSSKSYQAHADDSVYDVSVAPGELLGAPTIKRADYAVDSTRLALRRSPIAASSFKSTMITDLPLNCTTRCTIPKRTCFFCDTCINPAIRRRSMSVYATIAPIECANCSVPLCANCTIHMERMAQAAMPLICDLPRGASNTQSADITKCVGLKLTSKPDTGPSSPRQIPKDSISVITISRNVQDPESPLEQALKLAPKAIFDVLSSNGNSLEAVWCSNSLTVSNGVCSMIAKNTLTFHDYCNIMFGLHGMYKRLQKYMSSDYGSSATINPRKSVGLCTPRASDIRKEHTLQPLVRETTSDYGASAVAHIIAEEHWIVRGYAWQNLVRTAEVLTLCPYCATFFTDAPCLFRRT